MLKTLAAILLLLAIPISVFVFPAAFAVMMASAFYIAIGLLASVFVSVLGSLLWKRWFPESFSKSGITVGQPQSTGYVGSPGLGSRLRVQDTGTEIRVEWATADYLVVLLALCLFGPGAVLLYIRSPQKFSQHLPPLAIAGIAAFVIFLCGAFVRTLWVYLRCRPALRITNSDIEFLAGKKRVKTLSSGGVHSLAIRNYAYNDGHQRSVPNYILAAETNLGEEFLCISDSRAQIEQLMTALAHRIGVSLQSVPQPPVR